MAALVAAHSGTRHAKTVQDEVAALDKSLSSSAQGARHLRQHRPLRYPHGFHRLLDVQRPRFTVGAYPVPIMQPKCHVAGRLDFGNQQPLAQCVNGAGRQQEAIARGRLDRMKSFFQAPRLQSSKQSIPIQRVRQTRVQPAAGLSMDYHPGLGLAWVTQVHAPGRLVIGMHLYRKPLLRIQQL